jgi:uncharacterized protein Yka (UPF0111/DUF47 family)
MFRRAQIDRTLADLLEAQARNARGAAETLGRLLGALPEVGDLPARLAEHEREGDRLTRELLARAGALRRPPALLRGIGAGALAKALDDVVDQIEQAGAYLELYGIEAPLEQAQRYAELLASAAGELEAAIRAVRAGSYPERALAALAELENAGDRLERDALSSLFVGGVDPLIAMRWRDVLGALEAALDDARQVGYLIAALLQRNVG